MALIHRAGSLRFFEAPATQEKPANKTDNKKSGKNKSGRKKTAPKKAAAKRSKK